MISLKVTTADKKEAKNDDTLKSQSLNESAYLTIEDFIGTLRRELTKKEYENFGVALAQWQKGEQFVKFCHKALEILGSNRLHIFIGIFFMNNKNSLIYIQG